MTATPGQADPWQVITDVMTELLRGGQTAVIRCGSALKVLERAGIDFDGKPVAAAAQEPHAAPELLRGPCPFEGHDGEHLRLNTHGHWLCAIQLTNMLVAADVIADPAPDVTRLRAELDEEQGYRSELTNDILLNAPESFDGDEAADVIAVRYVRHLEAEIAEHADPKPAPELAAAMAESGELRKLIASILGTFKDAHYGDSKRSDVGKRTFAKWRERAGLPS